MTTADNDDLFRRVDPLELARQHAAMFTPEFLAYLPSNRHVYEAFCRETNRVIAKGYGHYSARTIVEVLRHHSALHEASGRWKLNDWHTPYLARLFGLEHPEHADLFEFRNAKAPGRHRAAAANDPHAEVA